MIPSGYCNAINQFKDHTASNGLQTNWDDNSDGMLDGGAARYGIIMYLVSPGDTIFNDRTINREDFMMRIMPNEVGLSSPTPRWLTLTHIYSTALVPTPAVAWWAKVAEDYAPRTDHNTILLVGNLEQIYNRLKK
jgi:hypothetical protein